MILSLPRNLQGVIFLKNNMSVKKSMRILVVDDDEDIIELLKYNLEKQNFIVKTLLNSNKAVIAACNFNPDLIILDIMMPHPNGIEICRTLRNMKRFESTYIFFLTAKSENYYKQAVLNTGGDDFIEKVIGLRALTYKINSVLKNKFTIRKSVPEITIGALTINRRSGTVCVNQNHISLSRQEFELIFFFAQNPDKNISAADLINNLWGSELYLSDSSIDIFIRNLKIKMGMDIIQGFSGNHYRLSI